MILQMIPGLVADQASASIKYYFISLTLYPHVSLAPEASFTHFLLALYHPQSMFSSKSLIKNVGYDEATHRPRTHQQALTFL